MSNLACTSILPWTTYTIIRKLSLVLTEVFNELLACTSTVHDSSDSVLKQSPDQHSLGPLGSSCLSMSAWSANATSCDVTVVNGFQLHPRLWDKVLYKQCLHVPYKSGLIIT